MIQSFGNKATEDIYNGENTKIARKTCPGTLWQVAVQKPDQDDHHGMRKARQTVFTGIPWQRCRFHLQQNDNQYVPRKQLQTEVAAEQYLGHIAAKYSSIASSITKWMEVSIPEGLTVFDFPEAHRRRCRTGNLLERVNQEIKRRTRIVRIFPNEDSCLRLVSAFVMEFSQDRETGKIYLNVS